MDTQHALARELIDLIEREHLIVGRHGIPTAGQYPVECKWIKDAEDKIAHWIEETTEFCRNDIAGLQSNFEAVLAERDKVQLQRNELLKALEDLRCQVETADVRGNYQALSLDETNAAIAKAQA